MEIFLAAIFMIFIGGLLYCAFDTIQHANKALPPKSHDLAG